MVGRKNFEVRGQVGSCYPGTDTYRSDRISLLNWDVTCGDDCLALKGVSIGFLNFISTYRCIQNSTNLMIRNITCRGGNGIAIGSLGQYAGMVRHPKLIFKLIH